MPICHTKSIVFTVCTYLTYLSSKSPTKFQETNQELAHLDYFNLSALKMAHFSSHVLLLLWFLYCFKSQNSFLYHRWSIHDVLSVSLVAAGSLLRLWCYRTLGKYFTFHVTIFKDHQLITTGPYKHLVHPSYLGGALNFLGNYYWLGHRSLFSFLLVVSILGCCLFIRVNNEEKMLKLKFTEPCWNNYIASRWRMIPFVY